MFATRSKIVKLWARNRSIAITKLANAVDKWESRAASLQHISDIVACFVAACTFYDDKLWNRVAWARIRTIIKSAENREI